MKKLLFVLLACTLVFSLAIPSLASKRGACKGAVPLIEGASITVDGSMDAAYAGALKLDINVVKKVVSETDTYGEAYLLWTGEKFYLYVTVYDKDVVTTTPDMQESKPYMVDSVEMFFDLGNDQAYPTRQHRVDYMGYPLGRIGNTGDALKGAACGEYFEHAAKWTGSGYSVEMCIDMTAFDDAAPGYEIGLQLMINDMSSAHASERTAMVVMPSKLNAGDWHVVSYDYIVLGADASTTVPGLEGTETEEVTTALVTEAVTEETTEEITEPVTEEETEEETEEVTVPETDAQTEKEKAPAEEKGTLPIIPVLIGIVAVIAVILGILIAKRKK